MCVCVFFFNKTMYILGTSNIIYLNDVSIAIGALRASGFFLILFIVIFRWSLNKILHLRWGLRVQLYLYLAFVPKLIFLITQLKVTYLCVYLYYKKLYRVLKNPFSASSEFTFLLEHVQIPPRVGRVEVIVDFVYQLLSFKLRKSAVLFVDSRWAKKLNEGSAHSNIYFSRKQTFILFHVKV